LGKKDPKESNVPFQIDPAAFSAAMFLAAQGKYEAAGRVLAQAIEEILKPYEEAVKKKED